MSILHAKSPIYHTPHGRGILLSLLWPSVICGLIISACLIAGIQPAASLSMVVAAIIGGCLTGLVYIILLIRIYQRLARTKQIFKLRPSNLSGADFQTKISESMIQEEFNPQHNLMVAKSDWRQQLIKFEPVANYQLYDIIFDIYRSGRYGHYLVRKAFYTVFEIKLNKAVPQLIFDAKQGKGQQFKLLYAQSQRLSFGGHLYTKSQTTSQDADFNDLFMAYSPMHHAVETYSFITPEVIEAILELQHYDLEFLDDRLFCYAPLLDKPTLAKFERQCLNLYAKVNDNLRVYTASIPEKSPMSRRLLGSPWKHLPLTAMSGVGLILFLFLLVTHDFTEGWGDAIEPMIFSDLCGLGFLLGIIQIISTFKHNRTTTKKLLEAQTKSQQPPP